MQDQTTAGPVAPTKSARVRLRPLGLPAARIDAGFWADRQQVNRTVSIPQGAQRLREAGNLDDLRLAAERVVDAGALPRAMVHGLRRAQVARGRRLGVGAASPSSRARRPSSVRDHAAVAAAQLDDGYVEQLRAGQAGLERARTPTCRGATSSTARGTCSRRPSRSSAATGTPRAARRRGHPLADHLVDTFGDRPGRSTTSTATPWSRWRWSSCTARPATRALPRPGAATRSMRGAAWRPAPIQHRTASEPTYFSDRVPVREADDGRGPRRARRLPGRRRGRPRRSRPATPSCWPRCDTAVAAPWCDTKMYLTGGLGSRWEGEAFGDPYELPTDRGVRRDLRRHRQRAVELAHAAGHRRGPLRRPDRAHAAQRVPAPASP